MSHVEKYTLETLTPNHLAEWDALLAESSRPGIFSTFDYISISLKHFQDDEQVFFLFFRDSSDARLIAVFPLSQWQEKNYGVKTTVLTHAVIPEGSEIDKPYPIIAKGQEEACWRRLSGYLKHDFRSWDVLDYDELVAESYLNKGLKELFPFPAYHTKCSPGPQSPIVNLSGEWEDFWNAHRKLRKKCRRLERRIGENLRYRITNDPDDVQQCLDEYIATEKISWKKGEMVAGCEAFYRDLMPVLAARGCLHFGMMYDGDTVVSIEVAYTYEDRVYFSHGTYAPDYAEMSPGAVNSCWFIQYFHGKGFTDGDYLAGYADYVSPWAYRQQETVDIVVRRLGWKNWYLAGCHLITRVLRRMKRIVRR